MSQTTAEPEMTKNRFQDECKKTACHWLIESLPDEAMKEAVETLADILTFYAEGEKK